MWGCDHGRRSDSLCEMSSDTVVSSGAFISGARGRGPGLSTLGSKVLFIWLVWKLCTELRRGRSIMCINVSGMKKTLQTSLLFKCCVEIWADKYIRAQPTIIILWDLRARQNNVVKKCKECGVWSYFIQSKEHGSRLMLASKTYSAYETCKNVLKMHTIVE